jgi:hypothetical protein
MPSGSHAAQHLEPLAAQVVAEDDGGLRPQSRRAAGSEAIDVDRLAQAHHRRRFGHRPDAVGHAIAERDHRGDDAAERGRQLEVADLAGRAQHDRGVGAQRVQRQRHAGVLHERGLPGLGQLRLAVGNEHAARAGEIGHLAGVDGVDRHLVAEPLELLRGGQQVRLAATERGEVVGGEDEPHATSLLACVMIPTWTRSRPAAG